MENNVSNSIRIYELAKELNTTSKRIVEKLSDVNIFKKSHTALITPDELKILYKHIGIPIADEQISDETKINDKIKDNIRPRIIRKTVVINDEDKGFNKENNPKKKARNYYEYATYKDEVDLRYKVKMVYNAIEHTKKRYGDFKKCEIHIHTPASHDYAFHSGFRKIENENAGEYFDTSIEDIIKLLHSYNIYHPEDISNIERYKSKEYSDYLKENKIPFKDFKEEISYTLLAHQLYSNKIHLALVADHNTIDGFIKLRFAAKEYYKNIEQGDIVPHFVNIFLGVEITCSDENHVVGIFDEADIEKVKEFIKEIITNPKEGTYYPSLYVIERIFKMGGIGYIAHINSSKYKGNKPYKERLFNLPDMRLIGLTEKSKQQRESGRIGNFVNIDEKDFCFIYESDAHVIDEIGKKNTWIKLNEVNFKAVKKAIEDHGICIKMEEPAQNDKYIKGIVVNPGDYGFLKIDEKNEKKYSDKYADKEFFVEFSQDLNCIIGGRGTGKSTLINIIDLCFRKQIDDTHLLNFISKNKEILIVFCFKGIDYVLRLIPQVQHINDDGSIDFLKDAFDSPFFPKKDLHELSDIWYEFYRVKDENNFLKISNGNKIIKEFYRRGYSINDLVNRIKYGTISEFIRSIVLYGLDYKNISTEIIKIRQKGDADLEKHLSKSLHNIQSYIEEQAQIINDSIIGFNDEYNNQLKITYKNSCSNADEIIDMFAKELSSREESQHVAKTYLQWKEVLVYLRVIIEKVGYLEFLNLLLNKKYSILDAEVKISDYIEKDIKNWMVESGIFDITSNNIHQVYDAIKSKLVKTRGFLRNSVLYWIQMENHFLLSLM